VEKTQWHPQAERRIAFVSLDGAAARRIQEGDVVGRYVVSEIQPSGVVFLDDGEKVRRGVGAK
jgi:aspartate 1-decarboxylase